MIAIDAKSVKKIAKGKLLMIMKSDRKVDPGKESGFRFHDLMISEKRCAIGASILY